MSDCRRTTEQLAPYLDGELPPADRDILKQHLEACPPCRDVAAAAEGGRRVLRERGQRLAGETLPPGLRSRCEMLARGQRGRAVHWWQRRLLPGLSIAGLVMVTIAILFVLGTRRSNVLLAQQLTADHVKCFALFAPRDSPPIEARQAEEAMARRYGWDLHIPPSSAVDGVALVGARRCLYASGTIPHVMYRIDDDNVSLFVLDGVSRPQADLVTLGHHSKIWSQGQRTYVLVSSRADADLTRAASYVMRQMP
jgi:anti-sigma factor RsiW